MFFVQLLGLCVGLIGSSNRGKQMNRITLLDGARFISAHIGAHVYFDSRHRLIETTLDKGIKGELMQERQADGSYQDQPNH
jgi:hypothetical protein